MSEALSDLASSLSQIRSDRRASHLTNEDQVATPTFAVDGIMNAASRGNNGFDLAMRCHEIVQWRRTGLYNGTELQRMADSLHDQSEEDPPLARAELLTVKEALQFLAVFHGYSDFRVETNTQISML